jgi:hypothetical protein
MEPVGECESEPNSIYLFDTQCCRNRKNVFFSAATSSALTVVTVVLVCGVLWPAREGCADTRKWGKALIPVTGGEGEVGSDSTTMYQLEHMNH